MASLPPQRRQSGGPGGGPGQGRPSRNLSPKEGAEEAEKRTGLPTFHVGQKVQGMFGCAGAWPGSSPSGTGRGPLSR